MRSSRRLAVVGIGLSLSVFAQASVVKRTILTSGTTVFPIHYQLGQSTVLYFGFKPETVICGNKNYFNIEKIKQGLTIQPLSNFSTNLTIISGDKRYLFFLSPANRVPVDGFIDVVWVPSTEIQSVAKGSSDKSVNLNKMATVGKSLRFTLEKEISTGNRRILEFSAANLGGELITTSKIQVDVQCGEMPIVKQMVAWEKDAIQKSESIHGRIIFQSQSCKNLSMNAGFDHRISKILVKGSSH